MTFNLTARITPKAPRTEDKVEARDRVKTTRAGGEQDMWAIPKVRVGNYVQGQDPKKKEG